MRYRYYKKTNSQLNVQLEQTQAKDEMVLTLSKSILSGFNFVGILKIFLPLFFIFFSLSAFSQNVVINEQGVSTSTNPSTTVLDLSASQLGFLLPSMANTTGVSSPSTALMVFNSTMNCFETYSVINATWQPYWCFCVGPPTPAITFASNPVSICKGGSQTFSVSNANSINASSYLWTVQSTLTNPASTITSGQGTSSITLPVTSTAGTYTMTVAATNACGTTTASTLTVTVIAAGGNPTVAPSSNTPVCSGNTVTLFANSTNSPTSYSWTPAAGLSCNTCANPTITGVTGSVTYSVTATNGCGTSPQGTTAVTVNATPVITSVTATPTLICSGSSSTLTVAPAASTYAWSPNTNLSSSTAISVTANPLATTTYSVTETTAAGCSSTSSSVTVNVNASPTSPTITTTYRDPCGGTKLAKGQTIAYSITPAANCTYSWTPTGCTLSATTGTSVNATWTANGTESLSVLATNTLTGCVSTSAYTLTVSVPATNSCTFNTAGLSTFVVPTGITTCTVDAYGAQGGQALANTTVGTGGLGAHAHAVVAVTGGTTLNCYVGAQGSSPAISSAGGTGGTGGNSDENGGNGFGNAATSYPSNPTGFGSGGGGGGASCVRLSTTTAFANDIVSAAGGGGVGLDGAGGGPLYNSPENGGNGGGAGSAPTTGSANWNVDEEGTIGAAGSAGAATTGFGCGSGSEIHGYAGTIGNGGNGGETDGATNTCGDFGSGGGGGGGHYAGGGGCGGGGGGGYSYTGGSGANTTSGTSVTAGAQSGDGQIIITW